MAESKQVHSSYTDGLEVGTRNEETDLLGELDTLQKPLSGEVKISQIIDNLVREGDLYESLSEGSVHCFSCEHNCKIKSGSRGICQVRYNLSGKLLVPWGYVAALQCDPIEKKPFFHVLPGNDVLTFGMLGCDLHCAYCQNWDISQTLRDAQAGRPPVKVRPTELINIAHKYGAKCLASSYNEPLITSEWARSIFQEAKQANFTCMYVSNGNATRQVLEYIRPFTDAYKIDLKTMRDKSYRKLGTPLEKVLNGIRMVHEMGFWLEIVTLLIPGFNDSEEEIRDAAQFIKSLSPNIPWHLTAFHKDYRMQDPEDASPKLLLKATEIAYNEGLHFVYPGNRAGQVGPYENTFCPHCKATLIERIAYVVLSYKITAEGNCPHCSNKVPGIWPKSVAEVRTGNVNDLYTRFPKAIRTSV